MVVDTIMNMIKENNNLQKTYKYPIGTILIKTLVEIAKLNHVSQIKLTSLDNATNFYTKVGFVKKNNNMVYDLTTHTSSESKSRSRRKRPYSASKTRHSRNTKRKH